MLESHEETMLTTETETHLALVGLTMGHVFGFDGTDVLAEVRRNLEGVDESDDTILTHFEPLQLAIRWSGMDLDTEARKRAKDRYRALKASPQWEEVCSRVHAGQAVLASRFGLVEKRLLVGVGANENFV
ncbi:hypothetical protein [Azospirillum sp. TSH64]|uniref:hypothetical protein n=1 Tax=Azospirillum sp. TSH64 TaxID=652740 RepID=UPI000D60461B|nr:hypothetical protein [Azospirillum sp. TSH64]PWC74530.1 hypothetical protein TSH64_05660 [Azospirillum sp. TSH64]